VGARRYQDLDCWRLSNDLKRRVYAFTAALPASRDVRYCDQIRSAARSAPSNIAEGFARFRPHEFARFLEIARGSLVETQTLVADDLGYLGETDSALLSGLADAPSARRHD
jgi:four helix bundle protein